MIVYNLDICYITLYNVIRIANHSLAKLNAFTANID